MLEKLLLLIGPLAVGAGLLVTDGLVLIVNMAVTPEGEADGCTNFVQDTACEMCRLWVKHTRS